MHSRVKGWANSILRLMFGPLDDLSLHHDKVDDVEKYHRRKEHVKFYTASREILAFIVFVWIIDFIIFEYEITSNEQLYSIFWFSYTIAKAISIGLSFAGFFFLIGLIYYALMMRGIYVWKSYRFAIMTSLIAYIFVSYGAWLTFR